MLVLMALIPQTGAAYDALPLALIPRNRRESLALGFLSFATVPFLIPPEGAGDFARTMAHNQVIFIAALYVPALLAVLARPNTKETDDLKLGAYCEPSWKLGSGSASSNVRSHMTKR